MTWAAVVESAAGGAVPENPGGVRDAVTAVVWWLVALAAAWVGVVQVRIAKRAKVSGDAKEAAEQRAQARRDAVAEWQALADAAEARRVREGSEYQARIDELERAAERERVKADRLHEQHVADRMSGLVHGGWDFNLRNVVLHPEVQAVIARLGIIIDTEPPPIFGPPVRDEPTRRE